MFRPFALAGTLGLLLVGAAVSQDVPPPGELPKLEADEIRSTSLLGADVVNTREETIGQVEDVVFGPDGRVRTVVVSVGTFLGLGDRYVGLDWEALEMLPDRQEVRVTVELDRDELRRLPPYNLDTHPPVSR